VAEPSLRAAYSAGVDSLVQSRSGRPPVSRRPLALGELSLAAVSGGLLVALGFGLILPEAAWRAVAGMASNQRVVQVGALGSPARRQEAARRFEAFAREAELPPPRRRAALAALADLQETWAAAVAFFETQEEAGADLASAVGLLQPAHARELHELVDQVAALRLSRSLGPTTAALAEKRLAPLAAFVAAAPSTRPRP
jgi:hypothetical protein